MDGMNFFPRERDTENGVLRKAAWIAFGMAAGMIAATVWLAILVHLAIGPGVLNSEVFVTPGLIM